MPSLTEFLVPAGGETGLANPERVLRGGPGTPATLEAILLAPFTPDLMSHVLWPLFGPPNRAPPFLPASFGLPNGLDIFLILIKVEVADIGVGEVILDFTDQGGAVPDNS